MNICADCKHFHETTGLDPKSPYCRAPESRPGRDPVYGHLHYSGAGNMRAGTCWCGPDAVWFVQKEPPKRPWWRIWG